MPQKKRSRRSEPKLFRCTGFGDCNMVFTRSEHLARHARKHTGEVHDHFDISPLSFIYLSFIIETFQVHCAGMWADV